MEQLTTYTGQGLTPEAVIATVVYSLIGVAIMVAAIVAINKLFRLNLRRELVTEHNTAFGIMLAGLSIAIAIIIAGTIAS